MLLSNKAIKVKLLFLTFLFSFVLIIAKLFYLQIINPFYGFTNYLKSRKILAERGKIFDRNKEPLAINQTTYLLYAEPKKIEEKEAVIYKIKDIIKIDEASIEAKLSKESYWVSIKTGLNKEEKDIIQKRNLTGLGFEEEFRRYYPESSLSAHLLGFVGKNSAGENTGYFGIEGFFDKDLTGLPGLLKTERDLSDRPIFFGTQDRIEPENGRDLVLSIDKTIQGIIKDKLLKGIERYKAKEGCVIVAEPINLEVLGLVCLPDFDPDKYYASSEEFYKNPAISSLYEPGSTFKPLIMAAAFEEKAIKPNDIYDERGPVTVGDYDIQTWNNKYEGKISITRILEKSSNVGMVYIGDKLGKKKLFKYLNEYGFGKKTDIDLQGEVSGSLKEENQWYPIDYSTVTFGQGIASTPIQLIRAFTTIINGGNLLKPLIVLKTISNNSEQKSSPKIIKKIISEQTSATIRKILQSTIDNGEVSWAKPKGYSIGGKTGTAQIPIKGHYDPSKTVASFIGFAPVDKPRFIVLVILKEPKSSPWGSETAAPLFFEIAKELIVYYNIAPGQ